MNWKRLLAHFLLFFGVFLSGNTAFAGNWTVDTPEKGMYVLRNETGVFKGFKAALFMCANGLRLRKNFPLDKLPEDVLKNAKQAYLRIYCNVNDYSWSKPAINGANEEICFVINGKKVICKTSDPRFPLKYSKEAPQNFRWVDVEFPVAWLKEGKLDVIAYKMNSSNCDDFFYPGVDITVKNSASKVSSDGGASWKTEYGCLKNNMGEHLLRLVLKTVGRESQGVPGSDFASAGKITRIPGSIARNGVEKKNNMLSFPGKKGNSFIIPETGEMNITQHGFTFSAILRFREPEIKHSGNMMIFYKKGSYFLGRTGNRFNFSICGNGTSWSHAMVDGDVPAYNEWFHLAAVAEYINDKAQGYVGYRLSVYINGELYRSKMLNDVTVNPGKSLLEIGSGLDGYDFCGDIIEINCFNRALSGNDISRIAANAPLINKYPAGIFEFAGAGKFAELKKQAVSPFGKWLTDVLARSGKNGADPVKLAAVAAISPEKLGLKFKDDAQLAAAFNKAQQDYKLVLSGQAALLLMMGRNHRAFPVAGFYNRRTQKDVFADKTMEWKVNYRDISGKSSILNSYSSGLACDVREIGENRFEAVWSNEEFKIVSRITFAGGRLAADLSVDPVKRANVVTSINFPNWYISGYSHGKDVLVYPRRSGTLEYNPTAGFNHSGFYPGAEVPMQFCAYYDHKENGVYFGYEEPSGLSKDYYVSARNGGISAGWSTNVAMTIDEKSNPELPAQCSEGVIELYQGSWFEAGQVYKRFVSEKSSWWVKEQPRKDTPARYLNNPVWFVVDASPRCARQLAYLAEYFELPVGAQWAWWHVMPDPASSRHVPSPSSQHEKSMAIFKAANAHVHAYVNPRLWAYVPSCKVGDWRGTPGETAASRSRDQIIHTENYGKFFPVICPATEIAMKQRIEDYVSLAGIGLGGLYIDQMPCGRPSNCFAKHHGHYVNDPDLWVCKGYRPMMEVIRRESRKINPDFTFDGEDASEVYTNLLDGFMVWRWNLENHVPLYQSIYAGRVQFTGRGFDANGSGGDWNSFFQKAAEQLVFGEQIGWFHLNDMRYASPRRIFAKKLAHIRQAIAPFINSGAMIAPVKFNREVPVCVSTWGTESGTKTMRLPQVLSSGWQHSVTGNKMYIFVNTLNKEVTVYPQIKPAKGEVMYVCREGENRADKVEKAGALTLKPYASEVWFTGKEETLAGNMGSVPETLGRIAGFTDPGKMITHPQNKNTRKQLDGRNGQWINAQKVSWMDNCYMPLYGTLGWEKKNRDRWIQVGGESAETFWGDVDFGSKECRNVEIICAADAARAGGTIGIYDVTDSKDGVLLGSVTIPVTGDWFDFRTLKINLDKPLAGKRAVMIRFTGKGCNIRSWRAW